MINETEIRVIFADTDAMGIVYNGTYISYFERGRTEFMRQMGYPYKKMEEEGLCMPVGSLEVQYRKPAHVDDLLVIRTRIKELKGATVVMAYEIVNRETGVLHATGTSLHPVTNKELKPVRFKNLRGDLYSLFEQALEK